MVAAAAAAMAAAASFGGYTVVQELGKGGFATVYLATQDTTGEAYAIKQFTSENGRDIDEDKATNERAVLERLAPTLGSLGAAPWDRNLRNKAYPNRNQNQVRF